MFNCCLGVSERLVVNSTVCITSSFTSISLLWTVPTNYIPNCIVDYSILIKDAGSLAILSTVSTNSNETAYTFTDIPDPVGEGYQIVVVAIDTANRTGPDSNAVVVYSPSAAVITTYGKHTETKQKSKTTIYSFSFIFSCHQDRE